MSNPPPPPPPPPFTTPDINRYVHQPFNDHHLYHVNVHGSLFTVTVTATAYIVDSWVQEVRNENADVLTSSTGVIVVGLHVECGNVRQQGSGTLQLCVGDRCLIFQLFQASSVPQSLRTFLMEPACRFFSFGSGIVDRHFLLTSPHAVELGSHILNIRSFLRAQYTNASLETIARVYLGYEVVHPSMDVFLSDWGVPILSHEQVMQASLNARCAVLIARQIFNA